MSEPILICYDDSLDAVRPIEAAAALLGPRPAVVLDVLPWMTAAESMASEHIGRPVLIVPPPD